MSTATTTEPARVIHPELAGRLASVLPRRTDMTLAELIELADSLIGVAMRLAGIIHEEDPADAALLVDGLSDDRRWALPFVQAAMVDIDRSAPELFGWAPFLTPYHLADATSTDPRDVLLSSNTKVSKVQDCGTQAAWKRHKYYDEEPCDACRVAHRLHENALKMRSRHRQAEQDRRRVTAINGAVAAVEALREQQAELFPATTADEEASDAA